ncbi:type IVB secretion system protein IcmH/DotU [Rheinheimera maricola]|uniref:Type IVB secretion system protein IcmH/DotU n=1 Tax=Rheinheimera maricola TaxID=2793282 RepID=A0ABS7XCZ7_9GAMM|nr:type IVB secretion system protein IcmH/DotU [Rheinheimera maricola]MBZ9613436.1 type IVB secretion system protein IcmH/DotU [Rheinheimera maricola]
MNDRTMIRPGGSRGRGNKVENDVTQIGYEERKVRSRVNLASLAREQSRQNKDGLTKNAGITTSEGSFQADRNVLFSILSPIILLASKVKASSFNMDLDDLKNRIKEQIDYCRSINFGMNSSFTSADKVSYGLCCLIDEMVLNTPWGAKSSWANESLLVIFHKEAWGGERVFEILASMSLNPAAYIHVIEFYYAMLELGFEGKYRHMNDGMRAHQTIKNNTYLLIENYNNFDAMPLSDNWQSNVEQKNSLLKVLPQWVIWSVTLAMLVVTYFIFSLMLSSQADPIKRKLVNLRSVSQISLPQHKSFGLLNAAPKQDDLRNNISSLYPILTSTLANEIEQNLVVVEQQNSVVSVRLTNANLFRSGSDSLSGQYIELVDKIGLALSKFRVAINVTGHSDDIPIRTIKYADNWALSEARAISVKRIIEQNLRPDSQVFARGLADTVNLVPNTSAANRALNRRVEILVKS